MISTIGLSPQLEREMAPAAGREGLSAAEHGALLLLLGRSITREGQSTPFGHAVADVLVSRSLDVARFAAAIDDLIAYCAGAPDQYGDLDRSGDPREIGENSDSKTELTSLRQWRKLAVQVPRGTEVSVDRDLDAVVFDLPPLGSLVQNAGRQHRFSALGMFAHVPGGSEEFAAQKQFEIELEDRPRS